LPRFGHTMVAVNKTKVVLFGGATGESGRYTITGDTFVLDLAARKWKLLTASGAPPGPTAAHAACAIDAGRMVVYGGATGGRSLAADDIFLLDIREQEGSWGVLSVVGQTPGRRYGHTLSFLRPHLVLFGGNTGNEPANDTWFVNIERTPLQWQRVDVTGDLPPPRVYHAAAVCVSGTATGMLIVFGGRTTDQSALNDTWGLRKHRDGRWDWLKAPYRPGRVTPLGRYQHSVLFVGSNLAVLGGRTNNIAEAVPVDVYDTESSEWTRADPLRRFRHASWNIDLDVYVHGGFAQDAPNLPTDSLFKLDLLRMLKPALGAPETRPLPEARSGYEPTRHLQAVPRPNNRTPDIRMANQVFVSLGIDKKTDDPADMVKKVSLDRLQDEGKRLNCTPKPPGMSKSRQVDSPCDIVLNELLKPKDWQSLTSSSFNLNKELLSVLVTEAVEILQKEPSLVHLRAPVKVYGSLHGQFLDLLRLFEMWGAPNDIPGEGDIESFDYLFLGNYVDSGTRSLELICTLLALKVKYPDQIVLLRGFHEDRNINLHRGFAEECRNKLGDDPQSPKSIFNLINTAFEMMPLAGVIEDKFLCVHSGIGSSWKNLADLEAIRKPLVLMRGSEDATVQLALEVLLSEPTEKETGVSVSSSRDGAIIKFGVSRLRRFLADNGLLSVFRGHDTVAEGLEVHWNGELQTIISATDYAGQYKNAGAVLIVKKSCAQTHKLISPLPDMQGCWLQQGRPVTPVKRLRS